MTAIEGVRLDGLPNTPQIRRKIPTPFSRGSISISSSGPRRKWCMARAEDLQAGDTVPGVGVIEEAVETFDASLPTPWYVTVTGAAGNVRVYRGGEPVWAFTFDPKESSDDGR